MKAYTDLEQSKKLAEILPLESADHHYVRKVTDFMGNPVDGEWSYPKYGNPDSKYANYIVQNFTSYEKLPCWSLSALLELIPTTCVLSISNGHYRIVSNETNTFFHNNPLDAAFEMICWLKGMNEITCNNCKDKKYCSQSEYIKNNCYKLNK